MKTYQGLILLVILALLGLLRILRPVEGFQQPPQLQDLTPTPPLTPEQILKLPPEQRSIMMEYNEIMKLPPDQRKNRLEINKAKRIVGELTPPCSLAHVNRAFIARMQSLVQQKKINLDPQDINLMNRAINIADKFQSGCKNLRDVSNVLNNIPNYIIQSK